MLCQFRDLILGHTDVIQPLHADFAAGAVTHGLFDVIAGLIAEQAVHPDAQLILGLILELLLTVQRPAEQPAGVLDGDDAAGDGMAAEGVALADLADILRDLVVQRGDGGALPVAQFRLGAELFRVTEGGILCSDLLPQIPAVAGLDGGVKASGLILCTHGAAFHAAAVGDEQQIVLGQVDVRSLARVLHGDRACQLAALLDVELHIRDLGVVVELHAEAFQIAHHGQDDGLVLVIAGKAQGGKVRQTADVVDIALEVQLHLQCAVPVLEGEHGAPVHPEVGVEHLVIKEIGDLFILQLLVRGEEQLHDLHGTLIGQAELTIGVGILAAVDGGTTQGEVGVLLVQPVVLVQHAGTLGLQRRDGVQQIPHNFEVVVHLAAAAHHIADIVLVAIAGTAGQCVLFKHMDVLALHLAVAHQIAGSGQRSQTGTDDISGFMIHALRLFGVCKSFIIATGIVHKKASLLPYFRFTAFIVLFSMATVYPAK